MRKNESTFSRLKVGLWSACLFGAAVVACESLGPTNGQQENVGRVDEAVSLTGNSPLPCAALASAVTATTGNVFSNAASLVDSYQSSQGAYGGSNAGSSAQVQAAAAIVNNGGVVDGTEIHDAASSLAVIPVPAGAINLPLGSTAPGNVVINGVSDSITLAPGNYVAANVNVSSPGSITISPPGPVAIWVTGTLNLGGNENLNGSPANLAFLVTSSGASNINSGGKLFGNIYAPASAVNLNSLVFGSVVGSTVALNSGAAVHADLSQACPTQAIAGTAPRKLPAPPNVQGCYAGTWNGWVSVPCTPFDQLPPGLQKIPYLGGGEVDIPGYLDGGVLEFGTMPGIQTTDPAGLKFGQVDTTIVNIAPSTPTQPAEVDNCFSTEPGFCLSPATTPNSFTIQLNTNPFAAISGPANFPNGAATHPGWVIGDQGWVQFSLASDGSSNSFSVCLWQNDFTQGKNFTVASNNAYISLCVHTDDGISNFATQGRDLQPFDNASVAGFAFIDTNGSDHDLGIVAQLSWWDPKQAPPNYRGLYATVAPDRYGLWRSGNWTTVNGTLLGAGSGSMAQFSNASLLTRVTAGNCAASGTGINGQMGVACPSTLTLSTPNPVVTESMQQWTDETNNLSVVNGTQTALAFTNDGNNDLWMQYLAATTTSGSSAQCDATPRAFVRDYDGDTGSIPSNLNGQAFWESPDIVVVTPGRPATDPSTNTVIANQSYDIWIGVHNDYGCADVSGVTARVRFGDASLASPMWADVIGDTSDNYFASTITVPKFGSNFIGPIHWTAPTTADPHECLLAIIKATKEDPPTDIVDAWNSNQLAQRNIEIGNDCSWQLKNGTGATGTSIVTLKTLTGTANGQPYTPTSGDVVKIMFSDPKGQTFFNAWSKPASGYTVTNANDVTTVQLISTSFVMLPPVALAANQAVSVSSQVVPALFSGTTIDLQIGTTVSNGGSSVPAVSNGASCEATATTPPK